MKPISFCKTASDCAEALREMNELDVRCGRHLILADRIHDLTRWIPVSERMPENLEVVLCMTHHGTYVAKSYCRHTDQDETWFSSRFAAWQRITPPETP
jgi:hypothetical protein